MSELNLKEKSPQSKAVNDDTISHDNGIYVSAGLVVDSKLGTILADGETIKVGLVNMKVLHLLLKNEGALVTRAQIFDEVWGAQVISDDALTRAISDIRGIFNKHAKDSKVIETIPKKGYRWVAKIEKEQGIENSRLLPKIKSSALVWGLAIFTFVLLSAATNWIYSAAFQSAKTKIAVMPIQINEASIQPLLWELEASLAQTLSSNKSINLLASSAVESRPKNPFPYLIGEFGTVWMVEGQMRIHEKNLRIVLNLVDVRSATIVHSFRKEILLSDADTKVILPAMRTNGKEFALQVLSLIQSH